MPKNSSSKLSDDEVQYKRKNEYNYEQDAKGKSKDKSDLYKCGDPPCGKFYHSYTAFYNHCKKSHGGEFPENSIHNGKIFEGPSKNRGRPRIKKNETKDETQIEAMKRQNELIEFLGTLKTKKMQELIVHVDDPIERLNNAIAVVEDWLSKDEELTQEKQLYLKGLKSFNQIVSSNDLPQFYDPIESALYKDNLDSYNFTSVHNFMTNSEKRARFGITYEGSSLLNKILVVWLARILSEKLLSEVLYSVLQFELGGQVKERELLAGRTDRLKQLSQKFYQCFGGQAQQAEREHSQ